MKGIISESTLKFMELMQRTIKIRSRLYIYKHILADYNRSFMKLALILTTLYCYTLFLSSCQPFSIKDRKIIDNKGRQITIHGTNIVVKGPPYLPNIDYYDPNMSFSE